MSILTPTFKNSNVARVHLIMYLSTFILADNFIEKEDLDLLVELFKNDLIEDEIIHILKVGEENKDKVKDECKLLKILDLLQTDYLNITIKI